MRDEQLGSFLEERYIYYQNHFDISADPISIPTSFRQLQDKEISGFLAAVIAWGNRNAILKSAKKLMLMMDNAPYEFILHHQDEDLKRISSFYYRTFNTTDLLYFVSFLKYHYQQFPSLQSAFTLYGNHGEKFDIYQSLSNFYDYFFSLDGLPDRTKKHIGNVKKRSACKRLNMFLRWMVRKDAIDFGVWTDIPTSGLVCPLDIHVSTIGRKFNLIQRKQDDWETVIELTKTLRLYDASDPIKYDIVLFSLGIERRS